MCLITTTPNLRFTCEEAPGISLPFLDVEVTIRDRKFNIRMHHKRTFTGVLLHCNSIASLTCKRGLITCLLHNAYSYSSKDSSLKTEINFIILLFKRNEYPTSIHSYLWINLLKNFDRSCQRFMLLRKNIQNVPHNLTFCRNCNFVKSRHHNLECF